MQLTQRIDIREDHDMQVAVKTGTELQLPLRYFVPLSTLVLW
jgi:hypothetical protein